MRKLLPLLAIIGLLFSIATPAAYAQDTSDPDGGDAANRIFLPMVSQDGAGNTRQQQPTAVNDATLTLEGTLSADADKGVSAAARGVPSGDLQPVSIIVVLEDNADLNAVAAQAGGQVVHTYSKLFNGFSMVLPEGNTGNVATIDGVKAVLPDELLQLDTNRTPTFIGATTIWDKLGGQGSAGEGVVVGILDSGIWPENPAFADPDPSGKAYAAPAGGPYACDFGNTAWNPTDAPFTCNNKLIGAYQFLDTYKAATGQEPYEFNSARDDDGHGTHTASTVAGNGGVPVNLLGNDLGAISGIAPRAQIIAYKVCGELGCYSSDSAAAVEQSIIDGVDVLNFSISGGANPYNDAVSLAFLDAYANGIFVAASAGNTGPGADTVNHREPWTTSVAASTSDRGFQSTATLYGPNGDTLSLVGASLTKGIATPAPVTINTADPLCQSPAAAGSFTGQIVVCERGVNARVEKSANVAAGGAVGMFLYNPTPQGTNTDLHSIPTVHFESGEGAQLLAFLSAHPNTTATFTDGAPGITQGDVVAGFSSRGGPGQTLGISKPDITAPGVNILAGYTGLEYGVPTPIFNFLSGTSMSSPHIAGSAALLKALHPDWTPGQIRSALMTSALTAGVVKEDGVTPATPFDVGSGRVDLTKAGSVSITFDESAANYMVHQNDLWNANYPSLYVPVMAGALTVQRTVTNVTGEGVKYDISINAPADLAVQVGRANGAKFEPLKSLEVRKNGQETFAVRVDARFVPQGETRHATIWFTNKKNNETLHFPVTIVRRQPVVTLTQSCTPTAVSKKGSTTCTIVAQNNSFDAANVALSDRLPEGLILDKRSVTGGTAKDQTVSFSGSLAGAEPANVFAAVDPLASPAGYLSLSRFGSSIVVSGASDESISNFNVPSFTYAGEPYSRIGIVSNGYIVVGGGTGADVNFVNSDLPDAARPNNVLAPFWTDLNPAFGGRILVNILGDGANSWIVVEWEGVANYSNRAPNTFQVWIGLNTDANPGEDISFTYGPQITAGDGGYLTVGAENKFGNRGATVYLDGAGTAPAPSFPNGDYEVKVSSTPGMPGEARTITYQARGEKSGPWTNCAELSSDLFQGTNIACVQGEVAR